MTGYGKASCEINGKKITIEIKSLNSKSLDLSTRIPNIYKEKEIEIRNTVATMLHRGKVDLTIYFEEIYTSNNLQINKALVTEYAKQICEAADQAGISKPENLMELVLRMPDVLKSEQQTLQIEEWKVVEKALNEAILQLIKFREQEGASLNNMFKDKLQRISTLLTEIEPYESERIEKIRQHLEDNLKTIEDKISIDRNRLEQEMIFYIEKLDVNEEKTRLRNHLNYFDETMKSENIAGKKLGFIAQEMGREINTLGSKSNHSEMQIIVVKMKDELEQIKEQVLNVL